MICLTSLIHQNTIQAVMAQHPDLCNNGFQFRRNGQMVPKTGSEFLAARAELLSKYCVDEILTGLAYINVHGAPSRNEGTSYSLKHMMERWGSTVGLSGYVCNGAAIVAAVLAGYNINRIPNDPNCYFEADPVTVLLGPDAEKEDCLETLLCL